MRYFPSVDLLVAPNPNSVPTVAEERFWKSAELEGSMIVVVSLYADWYWNGRSKWVCHEDLSVILLLPAEKYPPDYLCGPRLR